MTISTQVTKIIILDKIITRIKILETANLHKLPIEDNWAWNKTTWVTMLIKWRIPTISRTLVKISHKEIT